MCVGIKKHQPTAIIDVMCLCICCCCLWCHRGLGVVWCSTHYSASGGRDLLSVYFFFIPFRCMLGKGFVLHGTVGVLEALERPRCTGLCRWRLTAVCCRDYSRTEGGSGRMLNTRSSKADDKRICAVLQSSGGVVGLHLISMLRRRSSLQSSRPR